MKTKRSAFVQRNQAVQRSLRVLELLSTANPALSLQQLSQRLKINPSTAHRILKTLEEEGYIARLDGTDRYHLGAGILKLSGQLLSTTRLREIATPHLRRLRDELQETMAMSQYQQGTLTYLDCAEGPALVGVFVRPGSHAPAHCVASGRVQLAFLEKDELEGYLSKKLLPCGQKEIAPDVLRSELRAIQRRGYALDQGNWIPGVNACAAPILDARGHAVAAITAIGFAAQLPLERLAPVAITVHAAANEISSHLGFVSGALAKSTISPRLGIRAPGRTPAKRSAS